MPIPPRIKERRRKAAFFIPVDQGVSLHGEASFSYPKQPHRPATRRDRKACGSHDKDSGERSKP
nr:MAG TPA: hypothetical protein [Caudoviricetes sp.]